MEERKAFNFYRSYYEIAKELPPKDRDAFIWALLEKQFENKETELKGLAKFAYISQKHSIDRQIKGYLDKLDGLKNPNPTKDPTKDPTEGGKQGGTQAPNVDPSLQEKEKEKEKEKGEVKEKDKCKIPVFDDFLNHALLKEPLVDPNSVKLKYESWIENNWKDGNDNKIKNWKSKLTNTVQYLPKKKKFIDPADRIVF